MNSLAFLTRKQTIITALNENENESLLIPAAQHGIYHITNVKNKSILN